MVEGKDEKKYHAETEEVGGVDPVLDGKALHDLYRHTTKLLK